MAFIMQTIWPFILILTQLFVYKTTTADPQTSVAGQFCNNESPVSGSVLADNFVPAMDNLYSVVRSNGYGTSVHGSGSDAVFGLGQCLEDLNATDCQLCFGQVRSLLPKCYPNTGGRLYLDGCYGRYGNYSFFDQITDSYSKSVCNSTYGNSTSSNFTSTLRKAVNNVTSEAKNRAGFAVGSFTEQNTSVYVLAQCWQVLNQSLCDTCLDLAAKSVVGCGPALEGRALFAGCYIRYSNMLFWNLNDASSSGNHNVLWIILGSCLGALVIIIIILGVLAWKRKIFRGKSSAQSLMQLYGVELPPAIAQSSLNFKYEELKKATGNFSMSNKLGEGSHGAVFHAVLSDRKEVAVKQLFLNTRQWAHQFFNEVDLISQVRHKNLVKLLGCSMDGPESLLIYEYYPNRSLDLFLFDSSEEKYLSWNQRVDIIQGVAEGLLYIHEESETRIIHRDIKASNILLDDKLKPKITDFGLAKAFSVEKTHLTTAVAGTLGYMAPEYVVHGHLTEKADVYSYGMLVLEIVTGTRCSGSSGSHFSHSLLNNVLKHYRNKTIEKVVDKRIYEESIKDEIMRVLQIGFLCIQSSPADRPAMSKAVEFLRNQSYDSEIMLNDPPFLHAESIYQYGENSRLL
ncbi:hypothetical protein LUZ60_002118 [Juncus effusus]|nr:hypothetical protein LUZ60_002118 [Juncus effusus]